MVTLRVVVFRALARIGADIPDAAGHLPLHLGKSWRWRPGDRRPAPDFRGQGVLPGGLHGRAIEIAATTEASGGQRAAVVADFISQRYAQHAVAPLVVAAFVAELLAGRSVDLHKLLHIGLGARGALGGCRTCASGESHYRAEKNKPIMFHVVLRVGKVQSQVRRFAEEQGVARLPGGIPQSLAGF